MRRRLVNRANRNDESKESNATAAANTMETHEICCSSLRRGIDTLAYNQEIKMTARQLASRRFLSQVFQGQVNLNQGRIGNERRQEMKED
jgi:hypothetical protein